MSIDYKEFKKELAKERKLGDPLVWRVDDPVWMAERREEWRRVTLRLAGCRRIHRSYWKNLKAYFFYGTWLDFLDGNGIHPLDCEFCTWWLHPTGEGLGAFHTGGYATNEIFGEFMSFVRSLRKKIRKEGDPVYGVMGGREQLLALAINPALDFRDTIHSRGPRPVAACADPQRIFASCIGHAKSELRSSTYYAHRYGLVLWDHLSYAMDIDEQLIYVSWIARDKETGKIFSISKSKRSILDSDRKRIDDRMSVALTSVLTFFDRDAADASRQRAQTVAYVEMLLDRYERRDFSDALLKHWDNAKQSIPRKGYL